MCKKLAFLGVVPASFLLGIMLAVTFLNGCSKSESDMQEKLSGKWNGGIIRLEFFKSGDLEVNDMNVGTPLACKYQVISTDHIRIDFPEFSAGSQNMYKPGVIHNPPHSEICEVTITNGILKLSGSTGFTAGEHSFGKGK